MLFIAIYAVMYTRHKSLKKQTIFFEEPEKSLWLKETSDASPQMKWLITLYFVKLVNCNSSITIPFTGMCVCVSFFKANCAFWCS